MSKTGAHQRESFLVDADGLAKLKMTVADLHDLGARSLAIGHEHADIDEALQEGREEIEVAGEPVSMRLHLAIHEIVTNQLWEDDPPEVRNTAERLLAER